MTGSSSSIVIDCPRCPETAATVTREDGLLVTSCGCLVSELDVRRQGGYSKREVAQI